MQGVTKIINLTNKLVEKNKSNLVHAFFWFFIASFVADQIINSFFHFPFFVVSALLLFPFLFIVTQYKNRNKQQLYVLVFSFFTLTILNSIVYVFDVKNISDLIFILLFVTIYYYYQENINSLSISNVYLFFGLSVILFSFTFIGIDSHYGIKTEYRSSFNNWANSTDVDLKDYSKGSSNTSLNESREKEEYSENNETQIWKPKPIHILKKLRIFHNGLFRVSHVASYFFGFLFLFFAYKSQKKKKILHLILLLVSIGFCIYTGSKTVLLAIVLSIIIFLVLKRSFIYSVIVLIIFTLLIYEREYILQITENTILYPYSVLVYISVENLTTVSRFQIWNSWWIEISEFGFWDFVLGKSFANVLLSNQRNLDLRIWFHNDFLNIFYTYGIGGILLYIWFFVKIYRDNKIEIRNNIFIFTFYFSMIISAFINGFYYYFPVFLLYLFFLMIKTEKQIVQ